MEGTPPEKVRCISAGAAYRVEQGGVPAEILPPAGKIDKVQRSAVQLALGRNLALPARRYYHPARLRAFTAGATPLSRYSVARPGRPDGYKLIVPFMEGTNGFTPVNHSSIATINSPTLSIPPVTNGTKRKRSPKSSMKFYAVRVGKDPGVYHSWSECLEQVTGFPKAAFKSFTSLTEAEAFVKGEDAGASGSQAGSTGKFYAVKEGRVPGVYTTWPEVLEQITGWKAPKHKAFKTRIEAELFVKEGRDGNAQSTPMVTNGGIDLGDTTKTKKAKTSKKGNGRDESTMTALIEAGGEYGPGEAPLPDDAEDGFDRGIILDPTTGTARYKTAAEFAKTKYQAVGPAPDAPIRIYTDGSTLSNGRVDSIGGVGVYFGPKDRRNISEPLTGSKQTNQRAELTAILRALEVAPRDRKVVIISDSSYSIKCVTEWYQKWKLNNRMNSSNKPVENKDLIQKVIDMLKERMHLNAHRMIDDDDDLEDGTGEAKGLWDKGPGGVKFTWVKGHAKDDGNNAADELAVNGARTAKELGQDIVLD